MIATNLASGREHTVRTDDEGRFRLALAPGTYEVSIVTEASPPFAKPRTVVVEPDAFADVVLELDTGIR